MRKGVLVAALFGALIALAFAGGVGAEPPKTAASGNLVLEVNGGISPMAASSVVPSATSLSVSAKVRTLDGTRPPALEKLVIDLDENGFIDTRGVPTCSISVLRETGADACPEAVIGRGAVEFELDRLPGEPRNVPPIGNELSVFNGGMENGLLTLLAVGTIRFPLPATPIATIKVRRTEKGRFGSEAVVAIPKIAEGNGTLSSFRLTIDQKVTFKGRKKSVLTFRCVDRKARARVEASFAGGTALEATLTRACTRRR